MKMVFEVLENDPLTNAGYGSNLTLRGEVEMDAAVMDGKTLNYGGCGAIRRVKNPIDLAYDICMKQTGNLPMGLVPPSLLVGQGGYYHAKAAGLELVKNQDLVTTKAQWQLEKYKSVLENVQNAALDTVGAVCIDDRGYVAAAASSGERPPYSSYGSLYTNGVPGGLLLKRPGRVGQAALYASGVWADSLEPSTEPAVAVVTSGCGEYLVKTQLAKEVGVDMKNTDCPAMGLYGSMTDKFISKACY